MRKANNLSSNISSDRTIDKIKSCACSSDLEVNLCGQNYRFHNLLMITVLFISVLCASGCAMKKPGATPSTANQCL